MATKARLIEVQLMAIAKELRAAGFTPDQVNALYHAMHRVTTIVQIEATDDRIFEGDDEREIRGY